LRYAHCASARPRTYPGACLSRPLGPKSSDSKNIDKRKTQRQPHVSARCERQYRPVLRKVRQCPPLVHASLCHAPHAKSFCKSGAGMAAWIGGMPWRALNTVTVHHARPLAPGAAAPTYCTLPRTHSPGPRPCTPPAAMPPRRPKPAETRCNQEAKRCKVKDLVRALMGDATEVCEARACVRAHTHARTTHTRTHTCTCTRTRTHQGCTRGRAAHWLS
jgi:hypothetical protein